MYQSEPWYNSFRVNAAFSYLSACSPFSLLTRDHFFIGDGPQECKFWLIPHFLLGFALVWSFLCVGKLPRGTSAKGLKIWNLYRSGWLLFSLVDIHCFYKQNSNIGVSCFELVTQVPPVSRGQIVQAVVRAPSLLAVESEILYFCE